VGCGEGYLTNEISKFKKCEITGLDLSLKDVQKAKELYTNIKFIAGNIYNLPYDANSFNLITALEVLEHLQNPELALEEIKRVSQKWVIFSVPVEPLWRFLNLLRGKYIRNLGNTPGHIKHWTPHGFIKMIDEHFIIHNYIKSLPWIIVLCSK
jgi:ubiquinone/menaquinone biosynthesis C-methylase UbiE